MAALWSRINTAMLVLVLLMLASVIALLAARTEGGPLDPDDPPAPTDSVRLPGTPISSQTTINTPGRYYLTRDLVIADDTTAVTINANDVELDLGGFTISGVDGADGDGVRVGAGNERVRIRSGKIRDVHEGVGAASAKQVTIDDVAVYSSSIGFRVGEEATLTGCRATGNEYGITLEGFDGVVRECKVTANLKTGVWVPLGSQGALIERSTIRSNNLSSDAASGGIRLDDDAATVRENDLYHEGVFDVIVGADAGQNVIIDNVISCATAIFVDASATGNIVPIDSAHPHTNVTHAVCE